VRVGWIQDLDPLTSGGGAQLTDRAIIVEGMRRGHDIVVVTPRSEPPSPCDLFVVSNVRTWRREDLERILKETPYVVFLHDYWPLCRWRLYFPMLPKCRKRCPNRDYAESFLGNSKLIVWLSPLHRRSWLWAIPTLRDHPYAYVPPCVDPKPFIEASKDRNPEPNTVLTVNPYSFKGLDNLLEWAKEHPDLRYYYVGSTDEPERLEGWVHLGAKPYREMPSVYRRYETFLFLPSSPEPGGRVVLEALLVGMRIVVNQLVGIFSYRRPYSYPRVSSLLERLGHRIDWTDRLAVKLFVERGPQSFWKSVEEVM